MTHAKFLIAAVTGMTLLTSCASTRSPEKAIEEIDSSMATPVLNTTKFSSAVKQFGTMVRGYPCALAGPVPVEVQPIKNTSGVTDGLPTDMAPVLRGLLARIGRPIEVVDFDSVQLHNDLPMIQFGQLERATMSRRAPRLSVRGSITEGETQLRKGRGWELDILLPLSEDSEAVTTHPGGSVTTIQRDKELDFGVTRDREIEVTTLAIDLQLYDYYSMTAIDRLAESYRITVLRDDRSIAFGVFYEGSGFGFRSRVVGSQSKSRALRMASELALVHLFGRYFRVPWWRIFSEVAVDEELAQWYYDDLEIEGSKALGKLKMLLYAHGHNADLGVAELTQEEYDVSLQLKENFGMDPHAQNDYEFIARLWETLPFEEAERRMEAVRRQLQKKGQSQAHALEEPGADSSGYQPTAPLGYPTVAKCCPFRFDPLPESFPEDNR